MRFISGVCAVYWAVLFVLYVSTDFTPNAITIGCALLLAAISFLQDALDTR
jgi:hypothetical protein